MFVKGVKIAKAALFPIFHVLQQASQYQIQVAGTGFFINPDGYFVSVAHVFDGAGANIKFCFIGRLPDQLQTPMIEIQEIGRNDPSDIFVGRVNVPSPQFFSLAQADAEEGRSVCLSGYPLAQITLNAAGGPELGGVRRYFQPSFVLDKVMAPLSSQGHQRKHDGFLIRDSGLFGMSGGAVFDPDGVAVGMQAAVTDPRISKNGAGREIAVENALAIRSPLIIDVLKANGIAFTAV